MRRKEEAASRIIEAFHAKKIFNINGTMKKLFGLTPHESSLLVWGQKRISPEFADELAHKTGIKSKLWLSCSNG